MILSLLLQTLLQSCAGGSLAVPTCRVRWSCQMPCNPLSHWPLALFPHFIIPSTSPWQTRSALHQRTTGYLLLFTHPPLLTPSLSTGPSSHLSFASGSVSLVSKGLCCQGLAWRRASFFFFLAGRRPPALLQVATFRKAPNGFGHFC